MSEPSPLLELLRDVHAPPPPPLWPPAPGWWVLTLCIALLAAWALWRAWPWLASQPLRWLGLRALRDGRDLPPGERLLLINGMLRRLIRAQAPGHPALTYSGSRWLAFLDDSARMQGFSKGFGRCLGRELYRPQPEADIERALSLARRWIRRHSSRGLRQWT